MEGGRLGLDALPWLFLFPLGWEHLGHICRTEWFCGDRRIVAQSSADACSQVSCSPGDWPDDVVQKLAGINQHMESWQRHWETWRARPCHPSSSSRTHRSGPEGLDSVQTGRHRLYQCCAAAPRLTADWTASRCRRWPSPWQWLPSWATPLFWLSSLLSCGIHRLAKRITACSAHSRWPMRSEHSLCLAPLSHCRCYRHRVAGHWGGDCTSPAPPRSSPIGLVQSPSSLSFLIVLIRLLPIYFTMWPLFLLSFIVHMFHGDVKVGAHTETIHPHNHLLGARWNALRISRTLPSLDICMLSELICWHCGPPSECRQTCAPASRSSLVRWGRCSICCTYQLR